MNTRLTPSQLQHVLCDGPTDEEWDALASFEPASLQLLAARALQRRVDSKFLLPRTIVPGLLRELASDFHVVLSDGRPAANYESLYYDTVERSFYHAHRRGLKPRHKVRIRHYIERDICFLESKTKTKYGETHKSRLARPPRAFALTDDDRAWIAGVIGPTSALAPSCWITFPRVTLVGVHHEERLTLDLGVAFDRGGEHVAFEGAVIAEIKQPKFAPRSPAMRVLRAFHARRRRVSKYCAGVTLLVPDESGNVFRPVLRDLRRCDDARSLS